MWDAFCSGCGWVGEHGPDWVQAVTGVIALAMAIRAGSAAKEIADNAAKKFPEWFKERRTVHRSQVATEALVGALGYLDAVKRAWTDVGKGKSLSLNNIRNDVNLGTINHLMAPGS